ncbi:MAG: ABC transporter ATP-binding protein [Bacteroidota bacterium]|jgi:lipopolysaccharide transport system ATP-binding protein
MSCSDIAIRVRNVSKHYFLYDRPEDRLKQSVIPRLQRIVGREPARYYRDFAALSGVSFDVRRGETVGIVGRNGSGKSTLLQLICGTLAPSSGSVEVNGRLAALLELGAGFNPEFTGRENVYVNGAILGLSRAEIDARFDAIAEFAGIGEFMEQPVKTYSSGMYVRLAFAAAINVDPEILVVDEALAVGDEPFQRKCFARLEEIQDRGGTILLVSHSLQTVVQLCSRALLLDGGELLLEGAPRTVVSQYQRLANARGELAADIRASIRSPGPNEEGEPRHSAERPRDADDGGRWFDPALVSQSAVSYERLGAEIEDLRLLTTNGRRVNLLRSGKEYVLTYRVRFTADAKHVAFGFLVNSPSGLTLAGVGTSLTQTHQLASVDAGDDVSVAFRFRCALLPGTYFVTVGTSGMIAGERRHLHRILDAMPFRVCPEGAAIEVGYFDLDVRPEIILHRGAGVHAAKTVEAE